MMLENIMEKYVYLPNTDSFSVKNNKLKQKDNSVFYNEQVLKNNLNTEKEIENLKESFIYIKNSQGIFGKISNGVRNLFNGQYGSNKIQEELDKLSAESSQEDIKNASNLVNKFKTKQDVAVSSIISTATTIAIFSGCLKLAGGIGNIFGLSQEVCSKKTLLGKAINTASSIAIGSAANVCFNQIENMTDNIEHNSWSNDKNIKNELISGAISGLILSLYAGISQKISKPLKKCFGLNKSGVYLAMDGSANVAQTGIRTALVDATSGAIASTAISDGSYLINCATDEDTEFSLRDLLTSTLISATSSFVINGIFGYLKGAGTARCFNKEFKMQKIEIKDKNITNENETKHKKDNFIKKNAKSILKKRVKSKFKQSLKNIFNKKKTVKTIPQNISFPIKIKSGKSYTKKGVPYQKYTQENYRK